MNEPVFRRGTWWQQQDDGTWLRWNEGSQTWERSDTPAPPPDSSGVPPVPPMPGQPAAIPYGGTPMPSQAQVPNYLVWAILVTLFCFLPTGIVAIVFASQVSSKLAAGDYAGAVDSSNKAKTWTIVSAVIGVVFAIIVGLLAATSTTTTFTFDT